MNEPKSKRSFRRISLRAFLLFATVVMILGGYFLPRIQRQRVAVRTIEKNGGSVFYDFQFVDGCCDSAAESSIPDWILNRLGPDAFHRVTYVSVNYHDENNQRKFRTDHDAATWVALAELTSVKYLDMQNGQCTVDSFRRVSRLKKLESIQISDVSLGDQSIAHLEGLMELRSVSISSGELGDASLRVFARLPKLQSLRLYDNAFTNEGLSAISDAPALEELLISGKACTIDDIGLPHLSKLKKLQKLGLQHTQITDAGLQHFAPMKSIKELRVGYTNVTWSGADQFKKTKRPDVIFQGGGLSR